MLGALRVPAAGTRGAGAPPARPDGDRAGAEHPGHPAHDHPGHDHHPGCGGPVEDDGPYAEAAEVAREEDAAHGPGARWAPAPPLLRGCRSLVHALARPLPLLGARGYGTEEPRSLRLRVEADGALLADLDRPVAGVSVAPDGAGLAAVTVRPRVAENPVRARARSVTVSGPDFRYRADALVGGPVRARTWTALPAAWRLTLPRTPVPAPPASR